MRKGLKGMASRMVLRRILHLREKSNLISVLSHDSLSVHFLWKPFGRYLTGIVLGTLSSLFRIVSNLTISLLGVEVETFLRIKKVFEDSDNHLRMVPLDWEENFSLVYEFLHKIN